MQEKETYKLHYDWLTTYELADEWLLTYAVTPRLLKSHNFALAHAVELYFKAAYIKLYDIKNLEDDKFRILKEHDIRTLLLKCQEKDNSFLPNYELREKLCQKGINDIKGIYMEYHYLMESGKRKKKLTKEEESHFSDNKEFYAVASLITDLKYLGMPMQNFPRGIALGWINPSEYWRDFFKEIRGYFSEDLKKTDYKDIVELYFYDLTGKRNNKDSRLIDSKWDRQLTLGFLSMLYSK